MCILTELLQAGAELSWFSINALVHLCLVTAATAVTSCAVTLKVRFTDRSKAEKKNTWFWILRKRESVNRTVEFVRTVPPQGAFSSRSGAFDQLTWFSSATGVDVSSCWLESWGSEFMFLSLNKADEEGKKESEHEVDKLFWSFQSNQQWTLTLSFKRGTLAALLYILCSMQLCHVRNLITRIKWCDLSDLCFALTTSGGC